MGRILTVEAEAWATKYQVEHICSGASGFVFDQTRTHGMTGVRVFGGGFNVIRANRDQSCEAVTP